MSHPHATPWRHAALFLPLLLLLASASPAAATGGCVATDGCITVELLETETQNGMTTYTHKVTTDCDRGVSFVAFELPNGATPTSPHEGGDAYSNGGITWDVEYTDTSGRPGFRSIKFEGPSDDDIKDGDMVTFTFTLPGDVADEDLRIQVKSGQNVNTASINPSDCDANGGSCRDLSRSEIDAVTSISADGNNATVSLPGDACDEEISFSSYALPSGMIRPFEDQVLFDNETKVARGGETTTFHIDLPDCAWQTDIYLGPVFPNLIPNVGHPSDRLLDFAVNEGAPCNAGVCPEDGIDFETDADGNALAKGTVIDGEFAGFGISVTTNDPDDNPAMIFDTAMPTGGDDDLQTPGYGPGNNTALGNVLIISEDGDSSDPDDNNNGGTLTFTFAEDTEIASVGLLDIDQNETATATVFDGDGDEITSVMVDGVGDNGVQRIALDAMGVRRLEIELSSTGAVTDLDIVCPGSVCEDVTVDLVPIGSTTIPADGGRLRFDVTIVNPSDEVCVFDGWLIENMPDGSVANPAKGPITITLQPGETFMRHFSFRVGAGAMTGDYFCVGAIGDFPDIVAQDGFVWTKLGGNGYRPAVGSDGGVVLVHAGTDTPVDVSNWLAEPPASHVAQAEVTELTSYPNPFAGSTTIAYAVADAAPVALRVYDLTGRLAATLVDGQQEAGTHRIPFEADGLAAGTYLYRLQVGSEVQTHRVTVLR